MSSPGPKLLAPNPWPQTLGPKPTLRLFTDLASRPGSVQKQVVKWDYRLLYAMGEELKHSMKLE